jgi:pimeloyl-ACP methyl ester carboxylesterase
MGGTMIDQDMTNRDMINQDRRDLLTAGAAAVALAAVPPAFAQQAPAQAPTPVKFYDRGPVRIAYQEVGSGTPLLIILGGGLNSKMANLANMPFDPVAEFKNEYRCIFADLRNAAGGQSTGPLEVDRPWDSYTDDHIGLMDHLKIDKFVVLGFCIGGPLVWNVLERAPARVLAAVTSQPVGFRPEAPTFGYDNNLKGWGATIAQTRPEATPEVVKKFLTKMFLTDADFVFTVSRDFVRTCQTPVLVMPDDTPAHSLAVAMECAMLAPKGEVTQYPWKEPKERLPVTVRQVRSFLKAHRSA